MLTRWQSQQQQNAGQDKAVAAAAEAAARRIAANSFAQLMDLHSKELANANVPVVTPEDTASDIEAKQSRVWNLVAAHQARREGKHDAEVAAKLLEFQNQQLEARATALAEESKREAARLAHDSAQRLELVEAKAEAQKHAALASQQVVHQGQQVQMVQSQVSDPRVFWK